MPPKKKTAATEGGETEGGAFRWTLENEKKLLILTQGRYLTGEDYERIVSVFPGTSVKGVQVRVSKLRVEQRKLYEEYGWTLPEGGAKSKAPVTPRKAAAGKKRGADADEVKKESNSEEDTPKAKKPRARKGKDAGGKKEVVEEEAKDDSVGKEGDGLESGVKEDGDVEVDVEDEYIPTAKRVKEEVFEEMV